MMDVKIYFFEFNLHIKCILLVLFIVILPTLLMTENFESSLASTIDLLNLRRYTFFLAGDFNLNLLHYTTANKIKKRC